MIRIRFSLKLTKWFAIAIGINSILFSSAAFALPDVGAMLVNFSESVPNLMRLVTAASYVMGMFFIIKGVMDLKQFGESRSMMSSEHSLSKPLMVIVVGTLLLYLPESVQTGLSTFWTVPNPYGYLPDSAKENNAVDLIGSVYMVIQLIGTVSFIKGLLMLMQTTGHGQPGTFSKALAHIIAGVLCINLYQFLQAVFSTLGMDVPF